MLRSIFLLISVICATLGLGGCEDISNPQEVTPLAKLAVSTSQTSVAGKIYWTDGNALKIQRANLDGTEIEDLVFTNVQRLALDVGAGKMYWTDNGLVGIRRANLDGTNVETIVTGSNFAIGLDLIGGKIYWSDILAGKIQRANLDGTGIEDLITGLGFPIALALDVGAGKMYWTDQGTDKIHRANLDGTGIEDLVSGLPNPNGIALDIDGGKMYWTEFNGDRVRRASLDGTAVETLVTGGFGSKTLGIALDVDGGKMYWGCLDCLKIQRANLDGTGVVDFITGLISPTGIALDLTVVVEVEIDIKPGGDPNSINLKSKGIIPVAVLTDEDFDATTVDVSTVAFGPDEAEPVHNGHIEDVDGDGDDDLVLHFKTQDTGIQCGDTDATLTGETFDGQAIEGSDSVNTVGCMQALTLNRVK